MPKAQSTIRQRAMFMVTRWFYGLVILGVASAPAIAQPEAGIHSSNQELFRQHFADYNSELRRPDGRVDIDSMVRRLKELGVPAYYWLIWHARTDWDDLKLFLPKAAQIGLEVWVYLVPPSESPPQHGNQNSEPFRLDFPRWAEEIARLSLQHTNLTAWVIDDFYENHGFFTPAYVREMQARARRISPRLAFLPLMYFKEITGQFVKDYHEVIDGVVVAYPRDQDEISYARAILNSETIEAPSPLTCPWNTRTQVGDFVSASLSAQVLATSRCRLRFREQDDYTGATTGYHFKQLLVDDTVVWERDVGGAPDVWREVDVDVAPQIRGKTKVTVAFRLLGKAGVSNFGVRWRLGDLRMTGLQPAAKLGEPRQWQVNQRGAFEASSASAIQKEEPGFHIPFIVMTAGTAKQFRLRHGEPATPDRIAEWLRMSLQAWQDGKCEGVVTYSLDKGPQSQTFPLAQKLFHEFSRDKK